ncbi:uncharacterized protein LOC119303999 [Triticum dicoccoides]|uniref:uncharacterized protein LOC119303999 n=1 Tax=Triticum dicoccoides TaxID=85692 RepID=UPI00188F79E0|nr:uncharacterized protein LOC119303999 [Triticum dicoccoides]
MKTKPPAPGSRRGRARAVSLPRKRAKDYGNVPLAELLLRVKKTPPPRRLADPADANGRATIAPANSFANDSERETTSTPAMEHDRQAEKDYEEEEENEEEEDE